MHALLTSNLLHYSRTVHDKLRPYACEICGNRFGEKGNVSTNALFNELSVELIEARTLKLLLTRIHLPFTSMIGNLRKHKKSVHFKERPYTCGCGASFAFKDGLQRHFSLVHMDQRPHKCSICNAMFKQKAQLKRHFCSKDLPSPPRDPEVP